LRAESTPEGLNYASTKKADLVNAYTENQAEHHQVITFQDELRKFLTGLDQSILIGFDSEYGHETAPFLVTIVRLDQLSPFNSEN